jgi:hypothetical protein
MGRGVRGISRRGRRSYKGDVCILWERCLWGDGRGVRGLSRRGRRSYKRMPAFCGSAAFGAMVVVCGAYRDGGVAPTKSAALGLRGEGGVDVLQGGQGVVAAQGVQAQA